MRLPTSYVAALAVLLVCVQVACSDGDNGANGDKGDSPHQGDHLSTGDTFGGDSDPGPVVCGGSSTLMRLRDVQLLDPILVNPYHCRLYALDRFESRVLLIDLESDVIANSFVLDGIPSDLALDPAGSAFYVALSEAKRVERYDALTGEHLGGASTTIGPFRIAAAGHGVVYLVKEGGYSPIHRVDTLADMEEVVTPIVLLQPDLQVGQGGDVFVGESSTSGGRLLRYQLDGTSLAVRDSYVFDGSFGLPNAARRVVLGPALAGGQSVFYAQRRFEGADLSRLRGSYEGLPVAVSPDGSLVWADSGLFDVETFVSIWSSPYGTAGAAFAPTGDKLYVYDRWERGIRRLDVEALLDGHEPGNRVLPGQSLVNHHFVQLLADPTRDYLYGLDSIRNQLVYIRRSDSTPVRREIVGPSPVHMQLSADGQWLYVATAGANEMAVVALTDDSKVISEIIATPTNPFKVAASMSDRVVYAEQDLTSDLYLYDSDTFELIDVLRGQVKQPDLVFDPLGRFLFAGEGAVLGARLHRWEVGEGGFEAHTQSAGEGFDLPARKLVVTQDHIYYAGCKFSLDDIREPLGCFGEDIWMVTPDDTLAFSASRIYHLDSMQAIAPLSATSGVMAVSPDSDTLYQFDNISGQLFLYGSLSQYK